MGIAVAVGTQKGAMLFRGDPKRQSWQSGGLVLRGWLVTAFTRDSAGRTYAAATHDVWGSAILASDDLEWGDNVVLRGLRSLPLRF